MGAMWPRGWRDYAIGGAGAVAAARYTVNRLVQMRYPSVGGPSLEGRIPPRPGSVGGFPTTIPRP